MEIHTEIQMTKLKWQTKSKGQRPKFIEFIEFVELVEFTETGDS